MRKDEEFLFKTERDGYYSECEVTIHAGGNVTIETENGFDGTLSYESSSFSMTKEQFAEVSTAWEGMKK